MGGRAGSCYARKGTSPLATGPTHCTSALTWSSKAAGRWGARTVGVGLAVLAPCALRAQSSPPTIDTIIVVNRNIFDVQDGDAPGFLARVVNHLHARTPASVIRGTLFANPGDPYDSARVAES